jgi:hypothetical protein
MIRPLEISFLAASDVILANAPLRLRRLVVVLVDAVSGGAARGGWWALCPLPR